MPKSPKRCPPVLLGSHMPIISPDPSRAFQQQRRRHPRSLSDPCLRLAAPYARCLDHSHNSAAAIPPTAAITDSYDW